jgi:hypothetical protein
MEVMFILLNLLIFRNMKIYNIILFEDIISILTPIINYNTFIVNDRRLINGWGCGDNIGYHNGNGTGGGLIYTFNDGYGRGNGFEFSYSLEYGDNYGNK